jgi:Holliday junction resolvase
LKGTRLVRIPSYLRTTTNKYKGIITEKVVVNYLMREGFICEIYLSVAEWRKRDWEDDRRYYRLLYERDLEKYSSELPPEGWDNLSTPTMTWDEYRKEELRHARALLKDVEQSIPIDMEEEREFECIWAPHLEQIRKYNEWLREYGHYQPDYMAKKGDRVFLVEVKSSLSGRTALLGEHQKKALLKAYDFGITPMLLVVPISISVDIGEPQLGTIEK